MYVQCGKYKSMHYVLSALVGIEKRWNFCLFSQSTHGKQISASPTVFFLPLSLFYYTNSERWLLLTRRRDFIKQLPLSVGPNSDNLAFASLCASRAHKLARERLLLAGSVRFFVCNNYRKSNYASSRRDFNPEVILTIVTTQKQIVGLQRI